MKRKRKTRAKNKLEGVQPKALIKLGPAQLAPAPEGFQARATAAARSTLFNAELEEAIDLIARERVYRAMLARFGRRLLMPPVS